MSDHAWVREFPGAVTVCDRDGVVLEMNDKSAEVFAGDGGRALVGRNLLDCHPEPARSKLAAMLA
ncbi:MAG TPA: PAS domain-containing protein, partial [Frankiaceae bacterium]|nr:PAS domain-containing protein [Frankiaceae bacterium]